MRYRYPDPRLIRRIDIVTAALIYFLAASIVESIEPHGIPDGRGTIPLRKPGVPDV
ncbi:MAG: hypothetical protein ACYDDU_18040 [Dermatophilaceae bacterium]